MNEKEKNAIIYFDDILTNKCDVEFWKRVKNLIEKQQKEIEELKKPKYIIDCKTNTITKLTNDFISKNKIREKIEEIENRRIEEGKCELAIYGFQRDAKIEVLQELLEEN